jgi:Na+-transporting NADH:ubiquinone oxidoreductase subunit A
MSRDIKIKKGLDLRLKGEAELKMENLPRSGTFAIKPPDFHSVVPKLLIKKEGTEIKAGDDLFYSKYSDKVRFTSPVSGKVKEVVRGAKRKVLEIVIEADETDTYRDFGTLDPKKAEADDVKSQIFESGCGAFLKQRPYDIVANPENTPKNIFISAVDTAPLAADPEFILKDKIEAFQKGIDALKKCTPGKVYIGVKKGIDSIFNKIEGVETLTVSGPHPAGNVGVQIHKTEPINQGDTVWTIEPEDVANIGAMFSTGHYIPERTIAVVGSDAKNRHYYKTLIGAPVAHLLKEKTNTDKTRIISGDVLTGTQLANDEFISFYDNCVTLIPEGNKHRLFGWLPFTYNGIPSNSHTSLSWLLPKKKYEVNTNMNGEERALVVTGEMEEVLPMDIFPMQLLKACMTGNIEKMEGLGIYEVIPEDFALVEYVNTSKLEAQEIIRLGLDVMITEVG